MRLLLFPCSAVRLYRLLDHWSGYWLCRPLLCRHLLDRHSGRWQIEPLGILPGPGSNSGTGRFRLDDLIDRLERTSTGGKNCWQLLC
jgi:hypothetical protein